MFHFGAKILFKKVYGTKSDPSAEELAEYAICIASLGNYKEAETLFKKLPADILNTYCVHYSDTLFKNWNYSEGAKVLSTRPITDLSTYEKCIHNLNLSSAWVALERFDRASPLLEEINTIGSKEGFELILANAQEISGQILYLQGDYKQALELFRKSEEFLRNTKNLSWIYSLKWKTFTEVAMDGWSQLALEKFNGIRSVARQYRHWETLRDCDLRQAWFSSDEQLLSRCYFGTPNDRFRKKILQHGNLRTPPDCSVVIGPESQPSNYILDLAQGNFLDHSLNFKNLLFHNAILALTSDLYRPLSIYDMFRAVYNEEYFNLHSSNKKTYRLVKRLRDFLQNHPSGLNVSLNKGYGYRLRSEKQLILKYPNHPQTILAPNSRTENHLQLIENKFGEKAFDRRQFQKASKLSPRSANRALANGIQQGKIIRIGIGRSSKYKKVC